MNAGTICSACRSDVLVIGAGPAGAVGRTPRRGPGRAHRAGDQLGIWRHGRERRTGSGANPGSCRPADP